TVEAGIAKTRMKVERRSRRLRGDGPLEVAGRTAILVDDGLASGATMACAIGAVRKLAPARIGAAVPTAHRDAALRIDARPYAVAVACARWHDVLDVRAAELPRPPRAQRGRWAPRGRPSYVGADARCGAGAGRGALLGRACGPRAGDARRAAPVAPRAPCAA